MSDEGDESLRANWNTALAGARRAGRRMRRGEDGGKRVKFTNNYNIPAPFENFELLNEHTTGGADLSVTSLIDSAQIAHLSREHDDEMTEDISDGIMRLLGTAVHKVLESGGGPGDLIEQRYYATIDGTLLSGQCDALVPSDTGTDPEYTLQDWKVTSGATLVASPHGKEAWAQQVNCYAWLARENGIDVTHADIWVIIRDWKKASVRRDDRFPKRAIVSIPIPLWTHDEVGDYIRLRIKQHSAKVPPLCTPEERWLGKTRHAVYKYVAGGGLGKRATRVLDSNYEANEYMLEKNITGEIVERPGKPVRCEGGWCPVSQWCKQYQDEQDARGGW